MFLLCEQVLLRLGSLEEACQLVDFSANTAVENKFDQQAVDLTLVNLEFLGQKSQLDALVRSDHNLNGVEPH